MVMPVQRIAEEAAQSLDKIRAGSPRVHCITNAAANSFTANVLLAVGATPSLTFAPVEVADFTRGSAALLINLGTLDSNRRAAIRIAVDTARQFEIPWVLDPVFAHRSTSRLLLAQALCAQKPNVIRANADELAALAESGPIEAGAQARLPEIAQQLGTCVALTGAEDVICDSSGLAVCANGHPLMAQVTAMGCALGAVVAAFCAVENNDRAAAAQAVLCFGVAGEIAGEGAGGPGSFVPAFLDALSTLDAEALNLRARVAP